MTDKNGGKKKPKKSERVTKTIDQEVYAAYIYHYRAASDRKPRLYEYYDIEGSALTVEKLKTLVTEIQEGKLVLPLYCNNKKDFVMRRKSYVVFILEDDNDLGVEDPVKFVSPKHVNDGGHTFGMHGYFSIPKKPGVNEKVFNVVFCVNGMKSPVQKTKDLKKGAYEDFFIYLPFSRKDRLAPDTGGTNLGPPVPPPSDRRKKR